MGGPRREERLKPCTTAGSSPSIHHTFRVCREPCSMAQRCKRECQPSAQFGEGGSLRCISISQCSLSIAEGCCVSTAGYLTKSEMARLAVYTSNLARTAVKLCQNAFQTIPDISFFDAKNKFSAKILDRTFRFRLIWCGFGRRRYVKISEMTV